MVCGGDITRSMLYFSLVNIQSEEKMLTHALCPYDKDGNRSDRFYTCLDLTAGSKIKLRDSPHSKVTVKYRSLPPRSMSEVQMKYLNPRPVYVSMK